MTVGQLLDQVRAAYIDRFEAAVTEHRPAGRVLTEVALRDESGAPLGEGFLKLPMRLDIVPVDGGQAGRSISVDSQSLLTFEHVRFVWGDRLEVDLHPFCWDNVHVAVGSAAEAPNWEPLQRWFWQWFAADKDGDGEPLGVVHFLSDPERVPSGHAFTADLGTAPVEAFEQLLDAIEALGGTSAVVAGGPVGRSP